MRLLTVFHYPVYGGPQNQAARLESPLRAAGIHTTAVVPPEGLDAIRRLTAAGVEVVSLPLHRLRAVRDPRWHGAMAASAPGEIESLRGLIRQTRADVVQVNGLVNPHAALAARLEGKAVVWQLQDTRAPRWLRAACAPQVLALSDVVMTTGTGVMNAHPWVERLGARAVVYYPPVDTDLFRPRPEDREAARAQLGADDGCILIGSLGNLNPQKGHEFAIDAVDSGRRSSRRLALRILGARTTSQLGYETALVADAAARGMDADGRFAIVEPGDGLPGLFAGVDIGVLAAVPLSEGVPTMVLEAMSAGIPVVATDVGGVREAIADTEDGLVVPPLDAAELSAALLRLAGDQELRRRLGARARHTVTTRFTVAHSARTHIHAYHLAVAHRAARQGAASR